MGYIYYYTHLHQRRLLVKGLLRQRRLQVAHLKKHKAAKEDSSDKVKDDDSDD